MLSQVIINGLACCSYLNKQVNLESGGAVFNGDKKLGELKILEIDL